MEDVADNLFHPDPYYRQGGDMVRVGGLTYAIDPRRPMGRRISEIKVGGRPLSRERRYKTASWAARGLWRRAAGIRRGGGSSSGSRACELDPRPRVRVVT